MSKYEKVKEYYVAGLWDVVRVRNAVKKEWITSGEYLKITGEVYAEFEN